jgi:hypothetical protein
MYLSKRVKVVAGVSALLGVVMAGGAGFTASGLIDAQTGPQYVGGVISQHVEGGLTLESIVYAYADDVQPVDGTPATFDTEINSVTLTFSANTISGLVPTIAFTGTDTNASVSDEYLTADWTCTAIPTSSTYTSTCTPTPLSTLATSGTDYALDVTEITVTVPSSED